VAVIIFANLYGKFFFKNQFGTTSQVFAKMLHIPKIGRNIREQVNLSQPDPIFWVDAGYYCKLVKFSNVVFSLV